MALSTRDVQLIVRARDQASRVIDRIGRSFTDLEKENKKLSASSQKAIKDFNSEASEIRRSMSKVTSDQISAINADVKAHTVAARALSVENASLREIMGALEKEEKAAARATILANNLEIAQLGEKNAKLAETASLIRDTSNKNIFERVEALRRNKDAIVASNEAMRESNKLVIESKENHRGLFGVLVGVGEVLKKNDGQIQKFSRGLTIVGASAALLALTGQAIGLGAALSAASGVLYGVPALLASVGIAGGVAAAALSGLGDAFKYALDQKPDKLAEAMAKLSPEARKFVQASIDIAPEWNKIRKAIQDSVFKDLSTRLRDLSESVLPLFSDSTDLVAGSLNRLAQVGFDVMGSPVFSAALQQSALTTTAGIDVLSGAIGTLMLGILTLIQHSAPLVTQFYQWVASGMQAAGVFLLNKQNVEGLNMQIQYGAHVFGEMLAIVMNLAATMKNIFAAADVERFLETLKLATAELRNWTASAEGQEKMAHLFTLMHGVFEQLLIILPFVAEAFFTVSEAINSLPPPLRDAVYQAIAWKIVLGPLIMLLAAMNRSFGPFLLGLGNIAMWFGRVTGISGTLRSALYYLLFEMKPLEAIAGLLARVSLPSLGGALGAISGPVGWAIAAIVALIAIGVLLWKNWDTVKQFAIDTWNTVYRVVSEGISKVIDAVKGFGANIASALSGPINTVKSIVMGIFNAIAGFVNATIVPAFQFLGNVFQTVWNAIITVIQIAWSIIKPVFDYLGTILNIVQSAFQLFGQVVQFTFNVIITAIQIAWTIISTIFQMIAGLVQLVLIAAFEGFKITVETVFNAIGSVVQWVMQNVVLFIFDRVTEVIHNVLTPAINFLQGVFAYAWAAIQVALQVAWAVISSIWNSIVSYISSILDPIIKNLSEGWTYAWSAIKTAVNIAWNFIGNIWAKIVGYIKDNIIPMINNLRDKWNDFWATAANKVSNAWENIRQGINKGVNGAIDVINSFITRLERGVNVIIDLYNKIPGVPQVDRVSLPTIPKMHTGGMVGDKGSLGSSEVLRILKVGEGVLTAQGVSRLGGPSAIDALNNGQISAAPISMPSRGQMIVSEGAIQITVVGGEGDVTAQVEAGIKNALRDLSSELEAN